MINFYDLPALVMSLYLTLIFLTLCVGMGCLIFVLRRKNYTMGVLLGFSCLICMVILVLYGANMFSSLLGRNLPEISRAFSELPLIITASVIWGIVITEILLMAQEWRFQKNSITQSSIKESFDHLNTGLCFSYPSGLVMMTNHKMVGLSFALVGEDIQNANQFWEILKNGKIENNVKRISYGETPEFQLPDGTIWTFRREKLEDALQLTAADTTMLHELMDKLRNENKNLEVMCQRIRDYGDKVDQYVIAKERLETRMNLHSFLGQALLTTRHFLQYDNGNANKILDMWQRNIDVLKMEAEPQQKTDSFRELKTNAQAVGINVVTKGSIPQEPKTKRLLTSAGVEAVVNAGKHADAKTLLIEIEETEEEYIARYTNDGKQPLGTISEGGGFSSLRAKVERAGGTMEILSTPKFVLTIILRKEVTPYD